MYDYTGLDGLKEFYTLQDVCEKWSIDMDELQRICKKYGCTPYKESGLFGLDKYDFYALNNLLYFEQCRDGVDDIQMWLSWIFNEQNTEKSDPTCKYIENIKGLKGLYSYTEVCELLGLTGAELDALCGKNDLYPMNSNDDTKVFSCYRYMTLNNRLYREKCQAAGQEPIMYD